MGAIDEGLGQIDLAALTQVFRERLENFPEHALHHPFLHSPVAGLVRRVLARKRFPRSSGPQDPQHSVENASRFDARTTFAVLADFRLGDQRLDNTPLLVSELHVLLDHISDPNAIVPDHVLEKRSNFGNLPLPFSRCVLVRFRASVEACQTEMKRVSSPAWAPVVERADVRSGLAARCDTPRWSS